MKKLHFAFPFLRFLVPMVLALLPAAVAGQGLPQADLVLHLDAASITSVADGDPIYAGWADLSVTYWLASRIWTWIWS